MTLGCQASYICTNTRTANTFEYFYKNKYKLQCCHIIWMITKLIIRVFKITQINLFTVGGD